MTIFCIKHKSDRDLKEVFWGRVSALFNIFELIYISISSSSDKKFNDVIYIWVTTVQCTLYSTLGWVDFALFRILSKSILFAVPLGTIWGTTNFLGGSKTSESPLKVLIFEKIQGTNFFKMYSLISKLYCEKFKF